MQHSACNEIGCESEQGKVTEVLNSLQYPLAPGDLLAVSIVPLAESYPEKASRLEVVGCELPVQAEPDVAAQAVLYPVLFVSEVNVPIIPHQPAYKKVDATWGVQGVQDQCNLYFYGLLAPSFVL